MNLDQLKNKLIEKNIIYKEDMPNISKEHLIIATYFLYLSEAIGDEETSEYDLKNFQEDFQNVQDAIELKEIDKVEQNKTFEPEGKVKIGVPKNIIPFLRSEIFPEIIEKLKD